MSAIKRTKYDITVSDLVRERADYVCEKCGRDGKGGAWRIDAAHIFGRRNMSVRYDTDNLLALCFNCHRIVDEDPEEKRRLAIKILGEARYEQLVERKNQIKKWTNGEKLEMRSHYLQELARLRHERKFGKIGYIEVVNFL